MSYTAVMRTLVDNGAGVDDPDDEKVTPLMIASAHGRDGAVEFLIKVFIHH